MRDRHLFWDVAPLALLLFIAALLVLLVVDNHRGYGKMVELKRQQDELIGQNRQVLNALEKGVRVTENAGGNKSGRPTGYEDIPDAVPIPKVPQFTYGDENAADGDWLVMSELTDPKSLNPLIDNDATISTFFGRAHDPLAGRVFEDLTVWEPYLARAWTKEMVCLAYAKDGRAKELAAEIKAKWDRALLQKLQIRDITTETVEGEEVLRLEIADLNNDYREALARDFGSRLLPQWWLYIGFKGQKLLDRKTDLTPDWVARKVYSFLLEEKKLGRLRLLPAWKREDSVVLRVLGEPQARQAVEAALKELFARPDNKAWVIDEKEASGGREEACLSCDITEEYVAHEKPVFTFWLRKDARWHDGQPLTGKDVIFTYNTIMNSKIQCGPQRNYWQDCYSCELVGGDPYVVRFTWYRPYFDAWAQTADFTPMAEHYYRFDDPNQFNTGKQNQWLVGSGSYKLERWDRNQQIVFVRNEDYYGRKPHFKRFVYKIVKDRDKEFQLFESGQLDVHGMQAAKMKVKENEPAFRAKFDINVSVANVYSYVGWNARHPFLNNKLVRQALTMLTDRKRICEDVSRGYAVICHGPVHPENPAYWKEIEARDWPYDPGRAKQQLAAAGWRDSDGDKILDRDGKPFRITLMIVSGVPEAEQIANLMKEALAGAGIDLQINNLEWSVFTEKLEAHQFDACMLAWRLGITEDPYQLWHSSQTDVKESNFCYFVHKEADRVIEQCRTELNEEKRYRLLHRFQEIVLDEQPYTFLTVRRRTVAYDKRIRNVQYRLIGGNMDRWWVPRAEQRYKE